MKYTCPCCGYKTLDNQPPGTYEICKICFWEDDKVQFNDPDFRHGTNEVSLKEAQKNFIKIGASDKRFLQYVRKPTKKDIKDIGWNLIAE